jgi:hypothetical protein
MKMRGIHCRLQLYLLNVSLAIVGVPVVYSRSYEAGHV